MASDLASDVRVYAELVKNLKSYDEPMEVYAVFDWRDAIQAALERGETLNAEDATLIAGADEHLLARRALLVRRFPDVFHPVFTKDIPRSRWWWHLHEGPQVRQRAPAATKER